MTSCITDCIDNKIRRWEQCIDDMYSGVKIAKQKDPKGTWRNEGYAGVYVPAGTCAKRDEFCLREEIIDKIVERNCLFNCKMSQKVSETESIVRKYWENEPIRCCVLL
eukprot:102519_1